MREKVIKKKVKSRKSKTIKYLLLLLTAVLVLATFLFIRGKLIPPAPINELVFDAPGQKVKWIKTIITNNEGRNVSWSPDGQLITFDKTGEDGYLDVYLANPDGTNQVCLTCGQPDLPQKNNGGAEFHPSGKYLVFQSQNPNLESPLGLLGLVLKEREFFYTQSGQGINNNLWLMTLDGTKFWQLTNVRDKMGVLQPHFSGDGQRLVWAERLAEKPGKLGDWAIKIADFVVEEGNPHLKNIRAPKPSGRNGNLYETHNFSPDSKKFLFTADINRSSPFFWDIWSYEVTSDKSTQLTNSEGVWDEFANYSPDGQKIYWVTSEGSPLASGDKPEWWKELKTELWQMNPDGSQKERLTYFNEPGAPEHLVDKLIVSDFSVSPSGQKIIAIVAIKRQGQNSGQIIMIEL